MTSPGPTVARDAADEDSAFSATGSRLAWSNPWFGDGVESPESTTRPGVGTAVHEAPGGAGAPLTAHGGSNMASAAGGTPGPGAFVVRPRGVRVGPAIQRRAPDSGVVPAQSSTRTAALDGEHAPSSATTDWTGGPMGPLAARSATADVPPVALSPVQRAVAPSAPAAESTSAPSGGGASGASGAPGSPTAEQDLDDLARRLYDRIGLRLRRELLVERERSGSLVDRGF